MSNINTFGGRLKAFRKSKKLKGRDVGEILRVLNTQVSMIENNKTTPPLDKVIEFAKLFPDLDLNWLLTGKGEMLLGPEKEQLKALLQSEQEELQSVRQELESVMQELQSSKQGLQSAMQELQKEQEEHQTVKSELQAVKQELQKEQEKLQAVRGKLDVERNKSEALEELLIRHGIKTR